MTHPPCEHQIQTTSWSILDCGERTATSFVSPTAAARDRPRQTHSSRGLESWLGYISRWSEAGFGGTRGCGNMIVWPLVKVIVEYQGVDFHSLGVTSGTNSWSHADCAAVAGSAGRVASKGLLVAQSDTLAFFALVVWSENRLSVAGIWFVNISSAGLLGEPKPKPKTATTTLTTTKTIDY
jgi:hypothetical protein